jgi:hypothetical protein
MLGDLTPVRGCSLIIRRWSERPRTVQVFVAVACTPLGGILSERRDLHGDPQPPVCLGGVRGRGIHDGNGLLERIRLHSRPPALGPPSAVTLPATPTARSLAIPALRDLGDHRQPEGLLGTRHRSQPFVERVSKECDREPEQKTCEKPDPRPDRAVGEQLSFRRYLLGRCSPGWVEQGEARFRSSAIRQLLQMCLFGLVFGLKSLQLRLEHRQLARAAVRSL